MIVRLMGEGQYELEKKHVDEVNKIDNNIVNIVKKGDEKVFQDRIQETFRLCQKEWEKDTG